MNPILNIPEVFKRLSNTNSSNEKKKILSETKSHLLAKIFEQAYNHFITFGTVKIDLSDIVYDESRKIDLYWFHELFDLLKRLEKRKLTGNIARDKVKTFLSESPKEWADIVLKILKKDLRIGASTKVINAVYKDLLPENLCMSAMKYDRKRITFPVYADTKLDGVRCIAVIEDNIKLISRNGKEFQNYPMIAEELRQIKFLKNDRLDGEIVMGHFQDIMRTISRKNEGIKLAKDAVYNIFDIHKSTTFEERLKILKQIEKEIEQKKLKHLKTVTGKKIENENELFAFYNDQIKKGNEGIMIKKLDGKYEYKRSYNWMKMKPESTEDIPIVRVVEGSGKYKNLLGAVVCKLPNGSEVNVGSGFSDEERQKYWNEKDELPGQTIEVKYQEKTKDGSLRFPIFMRFRYDL